jgi:hypothetical protein
MEMRKRAGKVVTRTVVPVSTWLGQSDVVQTSRVLGGASADVDGDGFLDLVLAVDTISSNEGFLVATAPFSNVQVADSFEVSQVANSAFGRTVLALDLNDDDFPDVVATAPSRMNGAKPTGAGVALFGREGGSDLRYEEMLFSAPSTYDSFGYGAAACTLPEKPRETLIFGAPGDRQDDRGPQGELLMVGAGWSPSEGNFPVVRPLLEPWSQDLLQFGATVACGRRTLITTATPSTDDFGTPQSMIAVYTDLVGVVNNSRTLPAFVLKPSMLPHPDATLLGNHMLVVDVNGDDLDDIVTWYTVAGEGMYMVVVAGPLIGLSVEVTVFRPLRADDATLGSVLSHPSVLRDDAGRPAAIMAPTFVKDKSSDIILQELLVFPLPFPVPHGDGTGAGGDTGSETRDRTTTSPIATGPGLGGGESTTVDDGETPTAAVGSGDRTLATVDGTGSNSTMAIIGVAVAVIVVVGVVVLALFVRRQRRQGGTKSTDIALHTPHRSTDRRSRAASRAAGNQVNSGVRRSSSRALHRSPQPPAQPRNDNVRRPPTPGTVSSYAVGDLNPSTYAVGDLNGSTYAQGDLGNVDRTYAMGTMAV